MIHEVILQKVRCQIATFYDKRLHNDIDVDVMDDLIRDQLVVRLRSYILALGSATETVEYPADWWQHFKKRWFPRWALRKWPVKYTTVNITVYKKVCPHMSAPREDHIKFFFADEQDTKKYPGPGAPWDPFLPRTPPM